MQILKNLLVLTVLLEVFPTFGLLILASIAFHLLLGGLLGHLVSKVATKTLYLYKYPLLKCFHSISLIVLFQETLMKEVVAGIWSAFHLHKWLLFHISKFLQLMARMFLSYSYSSAPALFLVLGVLLVFYGLSHLQDQDDVDDVEVMEEDRSDSMVDLVDNNLAMRRKRRTHSGLRK